MNADEELLAWCIVCGLWEPLPEPDRCRRCGRPDTPLQRRVRPPTPLHTKSLPRGPLYVAPGTGGPTPGTILKAEQPHRCDQGPWIVRTVEGTPWVASYRVAVHKGRAVVAELHLYPAAGEENLDACGEVPSAGLTSRTLRRVPLLEPLRAIADLPKFEQRLYAQPIFGSVLAPEQLQTLVRDLRKKLSADSERPTREGAPDLLLAELAELYAEKIKKGPKLGEDGRPRWRINEELRKELGFESAEQAKYLIKKARRRGLLTETEGRRGQPGGELTKKAEQLLAEDRRQK